MGMLSKKQIKLKQEGEFSTKKKREEFLAFFLFDP